MAIFYSLLAGALATSLAEYFLHYNLVDFVVDKVKSVLGLVGSEASRLKADLRAQLRRL